MNHKFILIIIGIFQSDIFSFHFTTAQDNEESDQCANYNTRCNPRSWKPCCQSNNVCKKLGWGASSTTYYCRRSRQLGEYCENDFDCFDTSYAFCSLDNKCDCMDNYIHVIGKICKPLLTGSCETNYDCIPNHSNCVDNQCTCKRGFLSKSYFRCIPTPLGQPCSRHSDCLPREHMFCSDNKICSCKANYMAIDNTRCAPLLEEYCWNDEHCALENSNCINNKCKCNPKFYSKSNNQCVPTTLEKYCSSDEDCTAIIHAKCDTDNDHVCKCRELNVVVNEATCSPLLGGYCWNNESCFAENSICIDGQCQCKPKYKPISNYECIKSRLETICETDKDCNEVKLAKCSSNKKCICPTNLVNPSETVCLNVLGERCLDDHQCAVEHSRCLNYECQCNISYKAKSEYLCVEDE